VLGQAGIDERRFASVYAGGNGEARPCYHLPRFECDLVVSGYSVPYRAAIIKRWHELEAKEAPTFNLVVRDGERGVGLRELHRELESKQEFANWTKAKLSLFIEGEDIEVFNNPVKNSGGRPRIDYAVSIECAKHIAMMERTDRGRQVRQYFIDFEKAARAREAATRVIESPKLAHFTPQRQGCCSPLSQAAGPAVAGRSARKLASRSFGRA
jgi:phage anti-repressor protein